MSKKNAVVVAPKASKTNAAKLAKKAANIAAYEARCKALRELQEKAKPYRRQGFQGSDTEVIAAGIEADKRRQIESHLACPAYGWHLRRWLAGRQDTRTTDVVLLLIARFLEQYKERKAA